jgi:hypothetical protein
MRSLRGRPWLSPWLIVVACGQTDPAPEHADLLPDVTPSAPPGTLLPPDSLSPVGSVAPPASVVDPAVQPTFPPTVPVAGGTAGAGGGASEPSAPFETFGTPLVFAPTPSSFGVNAVFTAGDPASTLARIRVEGVADWSAAVPPEVRAEDLAEWQFAGLEPATRYEYEVYAMVDGAEFSVYRGRAVTTRPPGSSFAFALISDTHIGADLDYENQGIPETLTTISTEIAGIAPDFLLNLGDVLDFHEFGFNVAVPSESIARDAYLNYRMLLGETAGTVAHFPVIGNWDGENGSYTPEEIERARTQRLLYMPSPTPTTYPEGGGPAQDYYAFTWGDALFVVLNVMTYTPTEHLLSTNPGVADDWTLGQEQLEWLSTTLENATSKWRFLFIHHTVGGAAGNDIESAYGRGGGQAAYVGEQAIVHQLMLDHGVQIFFYGHDHVFVDMVVDDVHYTMPGSAGAPWTFTTEQTGYTEYWSDSGWATVDVTPDNVAVRFYSMEREALYEYALE